MTALVFILLAVFLALGMPIFIALALTSFAIFFTFTSIPLEILPQRMFAGVEGFALLAIPFFIFTANLMSKGGVTSRLIRFANTLVGHFPGGLAICAVLACLFFGAITGSSASTVVAIGGIMYPALVEAGYGERFSLGVVTCSALLGMIVPPSNAMIIYGSVANVSVGALFMSGIGAGLVFSLIYALYCYIYAKRVGIPLRDRAGLWEILRAARGAAWGLGTPAIILGGIYTGVFTPTESAAVSVAYGLFVALVVYRELTPRQVWGVALESANITARVLIMVAAATLFSWLLTVQGVTRDIVAPVVELDPPSWGLLMFANLCILTAGMFVDVFSNILIITPLLLPLLGQAGISPLHFGAVTTVNADLGNITPPFGLNIFVASGAFNKGYMTVVRAVIPWFLLALVSLGLITYLPEITMTLPKLLYPSIK
jgi:C4-dicarboxylate transporter, DctM subunit